MEMRTAQPAVAVATTPVTIAAPAPTTARDRGDRRAPSAARGARSREPELRGLPARDERQAVRRDGVRCRDRRDPRRLRRARRQPRRHGRLVRRRPQRAADRRMDASTRQPRGDGRRDQGRQVGGASRALGPGDHRRRRRVAAAARHGSHRPAVPAHRRRRGAVRGDPARGRRPDPLRQGASPSACPTTPATACSRRGWRARCSASPR